MCRFGHSVFPFEAVVLTLPTVVANCRLLSDQSYLRRVTNNTFLQPRAPPLLGLLLLTGRLFPAEANGMVAPTLSGI